MNTNLANNARETLNGIDHINEILEFIPSDDFEFLKITSDGLTSVKLNRKEAIAMQRGLRKLKQGMFDYLETL